MKKLLMMSALAMIVSAPVMAEGGPDGGERGQGGRGKHKIEQIFKHHDVDNDGVITKKEFRQTAEERFEKIDVNSDGEITKEEVKEHAEEMREKFGRMRERREERRSSRDED